MYIYISLQQKNTHIHYYDSINLHECFIAHRIHGAIYGNMDPINKTPLFVSIFLPAPWILWVGEP